MSLSRVLAMPDGLVCLTVRPKNATSSQNAQCVVQLQNSRLWGTASNVLDSFLRLPLWVSHSFFIGGSCMHITREEKRGDHRGPIKQLQAYTGRSISFQASGTMPLTNQMYGSHLVITDH